MKLQRNDVYLEISELDSKDYYLIVAVVNAIHQLVSESELDSLADNQEKEQLKKHLESILAQLSIEMGSKRAESYEETIIRKVLAKIQGN